MAQSLGTNGQYVSYGFVILNWVISCAIKNYEHKFKKTLDNQMRAAMLWAQVLRNRHLGIFMEP